MNRSESLERVLTRTAPWDIVVIGGGATGAGCALDAATRGLNVLLLEQHDFGKGTSSRSTKLIHGGVRYLRQGNISLVREALRERGLLLENAPHVVRPQEFVIPCFSIWHKFFYGFGLKIYDLLAGGLAIGKSRILSKSETTERLPNIDASRLKGGVLYYDAHFDDTRLLIDILCTADGYGATVLNYARVAGFGKTDGRIVSVQFVDVETGGEFSVNTHSVINATGVFCDPLRKLSNDASESLVTYSQGIHLVFDRKFLPSDSALILPKTSDGRVLFCIPWNDHLLVGTTDTPIDKPSLEPQALEAEIAFVLETAGGVLARQPKRSDVLSVWAGIRPLVKSGAATKTSSLSRSHDLFVDASGLITITGGKWTTYRRMAEGAVDKAIEIGRLKATSCFTSDLAIDPSEPSAGEKLHEDLPYTDADVRRAVRDEMARTVEDILARRTRVLFLNAKAASEMARTVAGIMAEEMARDNDWIESQITAFDETARNYRLT